MTTLYKPGPDGCMHQVVAVVSSMSSRLNIFCTLDMGSEEPLSLECVKRSDLFPRVKLINDDPSLQVPFPLLCGENAEFLGRSAEGVVTLTNFRFLICQRKSFLNIPLRLIESVEIRDIFYLVLLCKDATIVRCLFSTNEDCQRWHKRVLDRTGPPQDLNGIFAFAFYSHGLELQETRHLAVQHSSSACDNAAQLCVTLDVCYAYTFGKEVERMKFDINNKKIWRILQINEDYSLCPSYPQLHIVPASISDDQIKSVASFRSGRRFPSVVWRDQRNGATIVRCSQPELGWLGWRNPEDEALAKSIPETCYLDPGIENHHSFQEDYIEEECGKQSAQTRMMMPKKMLLLDCRSYSAAIANRAKGGGCESADYYTNCEIQFMNMANIHTIRKSFQSLRQLCGSYPDQSNWLTGLEATKWLQYIGGIIRASLVVTSAVDIEARPVLIHCSDGWDRTSQVSALAQLLLDPYYRTIQGFQWLVEREWLEFGHKFADRCGHAVGCDDPSERAPVFLQWLDCVYQVTRQFPCAFQFNEAFLVKLVQHSHACLFGTFLFNTSKERQKESKANPTASVWNLLHPENTKFRNPLYCPVQDKHVLYPEYGMHRLILWSSVYLSNNSIKTSTAEEFTSSVEQVLTPDTEPGSLQKTRSCENLTIAVSGQDVSYGLGRRLSDPNIVCGPQEHMALLNKEIDASHAKNSEEPNSDNSSSENHCPDTDTEDQGGEDFTDSESTGDAVPLLNGDQQITEEMNFEREERNNVEEGDRGFDAEGSNSNSTSSADSFENTLNIDSKEVEEYSTLIPQNLQNGYSCEKTFYEEELLSPNSDFRKNSPNSDFRKNVSLCTIHTSTVGVDKSIVKAVIINEQCRSDCRNERGNEAATQVSGTSLNQEEAYIADKILISNSLGCALIGTSIESSTDTLTDGDIIVDAPVIDYKHVSSVIEKPLLCQNGVGDSDLEEEGDDGNSPFLGSKTHSASSMQSLKMRSHKHASISTSTTDISDSHVSANNSGSNGMASDLLGRATSLGLYVRLNCNNVMCGVGGAGRPTPSSSEVSPSVCSMAIPVNSYTPTSTNSPTPGPEGKISESPLCRQLNSVGRHLDCDGLTKFCDPALERLQQMESIYQQHIIELENQLVSTRQQLHQCMTHCNGAGRAIDSSSEGVIFPQESPDGGELSSLGTVSNPASDVSWEQVDEKESRITLWVPDHVVTHCAACDHPFWIGRRKHHCRNCGKVYCSNCSNFFAPVPTQHLQEPVRVCSHCYAALHPAGPGAASDDSRIAALVLD